MDLKTRGSLTAKQGFKNEYDIIDKFNNWELDNEAKQWLQIMKYNINDIESVTAVKVPGHHKSDVQVQVSVKLKTAIDVENIQVKLVSNKKGFNQIDKRWVDNYEEMWDIPKDITLLLKHYTGELPPTKDSKDSRRMFINEFSIKEQIALTSWFNDNKTLIVSDILKGRGRFAAEWMLVVQKTEGLVRWTLQPINLCLNFFGNGEIRVTPQGNLRLGRIGIQRKGGDGGRDTAKMLQFKIDPTELFDY